MLSVCKLDAHKPPCVRICVRVYLPFVCLSMCVCMCRITVSGVWQCMATTELFDFLHNNIRISSTQRPYRVMFVTTLEQPAEPQKNNNNNNEQQKFYNELHSFTIAPCTLSRSLSRALCLSHSTLHCVHTARTKVDVFVCGHNENRSFGSSSLCHRNREKFCDDGNAHNIKTCQRISYDDMCVQQECTRIRAHTHARTHWKIYSIQTIIECCMDFMLPSNTHSLNALHTIETRAYIIHTHLIWRMDAPARIQLTV